MSGIPTRYYAQAKSAVWRYKYKSYNYHNGMILRRRSNIRARVATAFVRSRRGQAIVRRVALRIMRGV